MEQKQHHEMQSEATHPSGAEEWYCPVCGRRVIMQWMPKYRRIVLEHGDEHAVHSGGKGGLRMKPAEVRNGDEFEQAERMDPWQEWLKSLDFEDW